MNRLTKNRLRILDALVAEHIFGWKWFSALGDAFLVPPHGQEEARRFHVHWTEGLRENKWRGREQVPRKCKKRYDIEMHYREYTRWEIPRYSTNKESAYTVLEHLGKIHAVQFWESRERDSKNKGVWTVYGTAWGVFSSAETLAVATVLFALKINKIQFPWKLKQKPHAKVA